MRNLACFPELPTEAAALEALARHASSLSGLEIEPVSAETLQAGAVQLGAGLLPLMLFLSPGGSQRPDAAVQLIRKLRHAGFRAPIIALMEGDSIDTPTVLLDAGADDVLPLPRPPHEIRARINAVSRRLHGLNTSELRMGPLEIFLDGRHPQVAGVPVAMSGREYQILRHLALNHGKVVTRAALHDALYALDPMPPFDKIINVYICRMRAKLEAVMPEAGPMIETVNGRGYRLGPGEGIRRQPQSRRNMITCSSASSGVAA